MQIDSAKAAATEIVEGQIYYFCSAACRDKFRTAPDRYARKEPEGGSGHGSLAE
jgi:YHS domain-containing protein